MVARARAGDRDAVESLLRANYDLVRAVCRRLTGNDADAADAAQEAMISVVRGLPKFDGRSRFETWLYRIAVNSSIDELRRRSRRPAVTRDGLDPVESPSAGGAAPDSVVERLDIDAALCRLPVDYRTAVVLRDVCGLDYAEIASALGIPGGTVRSRIARGRAMLADVLRPDRSPA